MTPLDAVTDLDRELDRQLHALPVAPAPRTLLPRVMAAVPRVTPAPWYSRPWFTWPYALRVTSAAAVIVTIAALAGGGPFLHWMSPTLAAELGRILEPLQPLSRAIGQAATVTRVFWHVWLEPIALYLLALVVMLSLAVSAALSLVNRLTPERT
ncbi:MAG TPA: hypothetical protein VFV78_12695 [Vicinamibacterales bacterium]|nr:hypothetical protein [Vicinamibacterales bacterium]